MRDRIPFLFAALLVAALIAVVGVAAFSINSSDDPPQEASYDGVISGRVAAAIFFFVLILGVLIPTSFKVGKLES